MLTEIDSVFYLNTYPVIAVAYDLYPIRDPDPANLAPLRDGDLNCVEHFEGVLRGQGHPHDGRKYRGGRREFMKAVQSLTTWLNCKRSSKEQSSCGTSPVKIYNSRKYYRSGWKAVELIVHNDHAWSKDLHFP